jgi:hypothetical protein
MTYNLPPTSNSLPLPRCPHCGVAKPRLERIFREPWQTSDSNQGNPRKWLLFSCSVCGGCVMVGWLSNTSFCQIWPDSLGFAADIPAEPLDYLKQAAETLNAARASVVMSAGAVDAMLKAKGLVAGSLYSRIKQAVDQHLLTPDMADWAHDIRLDANDQRHADGAATPPDIEDAKRCLEFAKALADILFVLPARVTRGKVNAREAAVEKGVVVATGSSVSKVPPPINPLSV